MPASYPALKCAFTAFWISEVKTNGKRVLATMRVTEGTWHAVLAFVRWPPSATRSLPNEYKRDRGGIIQSRRLHCAMNNIKQQTKFTETPPPPCVTYSHSAGYRAPTVDHLLPPPNARPKDLRHHMPPISGLRQMPGNLHHVGNAVPCRGPHSVIMGQSPSSLGIKFACTMVTLQCRMQT